MRVHLGEYPGHESEAVRTVEVHIDFWDTWNLDQTLAEIIHPALQKLLEDESIGIPYEICRKVALDAEKMSEEEEKLAARLWENFIRKMIWSFNEVKEGYPGEQKLNPSDNNFLAKSIDYKNRIQEGLNLFAEYYMGLWT